MAKQIAAAIVWTKIEENNAQSDIWYHISAKEKQEVMEKVLMLLYYTYTEKIHTLITQFRAFIAEMYMCMYIREW